MILLDLLLILGLLVVAAGCKYIEKREERKRFVHPRGKERVGLR